MAISYSVTTDKAAQLDVDVVVIPLAQVSEFSDHLPPKTVEDLKKIARQRNFSANWASSCLAIAPHGMAAQYVALVGLGKDNTVNKQKEALRRGLAAVVAEVRRQAIPELAVALSERVELAQAAVEGIGLASYLFADHSAKLKRKEKMQLKRVQIAVSEEEATAAKRNVRAAKQTLAGVCLARDLVNQPANHIAPKDLAQVAKDIAKSSANIKVKVLDRSAAAKEGFTAFLSVAQGSTEEPYVIHLVYKPEKPSANTPKLALVGKGITFDSGGLSIKPADFMEDMKSDMAGAASVLGAFAVLAERKVEVEVHGIIAACENMPAGNAYRPGDVITAKNGTTIEVLNTDAEGRITLADALSYAVEQEPDAIIDLATLTGAAIVALGENVAGLWGTNEKLQETLLTAAEEAGENITELPMPEEYKPQIESTIADIRNTPTSRYGGAITAAMFLREFVGETPWVHLDIAGPSYASRQSVPYWSQGATGWGVRTLLNTVANYAKEAE